MAWCDPTGKDRPMIGWSYFTIFAAPRTSPGSTARVSAWRGTPRPSPTSATTTRSSRDTSRRSANWCGPEIGELVRRLTRAPAVFLQQNWVFRGDDKEVATEAVNERNRVTTMKTHGLLHADYYEQETAEALASMSMKAAGVTQRPRGRLLGINTWRSISPPPQDRPLALLDRRTLDAADFVPAVIEGPHAKLNALRASYNQRHRFCWWSDMTPDEVLVFLQYEQGLGQTSTVMHTAFSDPRCPAGTPPRQSIEARGYVFFDD
jgi:hypothetical protein